MNIFRSKHGVYYMILTASISKEIKTSKAQKKSSKKKEKNLRSEK